MAGALTRGALLSLLCAAGGAAGCGAAGNDAEHGTGLPDAATDGHAHVDGALDPDGGTSDDASSSPDGGGSDGPAPPSRFVTGVVSFTPGPCAGYGEKAMPGVVEGPPIGGGTTHGSTDVVSLGSGGSIVVSFAPNAIVDGPGPDFIVFENPFWIGGNASDVYAEPGEVSVSDDGTTWHAFPCSPTLDPSAASGTGVAPPYGSCAGVNVVYSNPQNGISPFDASKAGGDAFDLAMLGVTHARYVRIVDKTAEACPDAGTVPNANGFDLDAIAIVNAEQP